jgi:NAD(P)-dependent dehydrogenase (short-subunit alcohol dehydrogenase family)
VRLENKVAIITGGAAGIGAAIVRRAVREGASVAFIDTNLELGQALTDELSSHGNCFFLHGSVANETDCAAVVAAAEERYGPISILVNNAARFIFKSVEATPEDWRNSLDANVIGCSLMARFSIESMKRAGGGAIVNFGSISAFIAQAATLTYNATKAAIVEMTRCMALDFAPFNIRVNCVCPGYIMTPALRGYIAQTGRSQEEVERELSALTILKRLGKPEEIASGVVFLCSDDASYMTGAFLMMDGGLTAL